jgi:hypothetical protein
MSAEDAQIVRQYILDVAPQPAPTREAALTSLDRLAARLQEAEERADSNKLIADNWHASHYAERKARHAAEARETALREAATRMLKAHLEAEVGEKRDAWRALNAALAADPESEEAPE